MDLCPIETKARRGPETAPSTNDVSMAASADGRTSPSCEAANANGGTKISNESTAGERSLGCRDGYGDDAAYN